MGFHGFREKMENKENKESEMENSEKRRNQILEIPKEYKDNFESKVSVDKNANKENSGKKEGMFSKIKEMVSGESKKNNRLEQTENKKPEKSQNESFIESIKVKESPEEIKKRNEEHGYSAGGETSPKGGFERERTKPKEGRSVWDTLE